MVSFFIFIDIFLNGLILIKYDPRSQPLQRLAFAFYDKNVSPGKQSFGVCRT